MFGLRASDIDVGEPPTPVEADVTSSGARISFELGITNLAFQQHQIDGRPLPSRVSGRGLIDTGTQMSLVSDATAAALSLDVLHSVELHTALGATSASCYVVEFSIVTPARMRTQPLPLVVARVPGLREDMLVGLDVLQNFRAEWDGPAGTLRLWPANEPHAKV